MKLEKILEQLNSFEKNAFLKIIDGIINDKSFNSKEIDKILSDSSRDLKAMDSLNISKVFRIVESEFMSSVRKEFRNTTSQLDILIDLLARDGNGIMKLEWFSRLYEQELTSLGKKLSDFKKIFADDKADISAQRIRDYSIYQECLNIAYRNDESNNQELKITSDEQSIILVLSNQLSLSQEEIKMINYLIIPIKKLEIEAVLNELKAIGVIFYSKKSGTIFVADEMVSVLRKVRGKEIADKYFRRVLRQLREPHINLISKKHQVDWKQPIDDKIRGIILAGVSLSGILKDDIYKEGTSLTEKKKFLTDLCDKSLQINPPLKGIVLDEKISNLIKYFEDLERDEKVGISIDGYDKLIVDLKEELKTFDKKLKVEFGIKEDIHVNSSLLLDLNLKPRDVLEVFYSEELDSFCKSKNIKTRGDIIINILDAYKDAENLYLENYVHIGFRNFNLLKENGILIKEAELGLKFEELTKKLFTTLGFNVDEKIKKEIETNKDKIDIVLNVGNNELIIVECKTVKEIGYSKFSQVSRQLKSYSNRATMCNFKVIKSLLVGPEFSDDFIKESGLELELNLSLISAASLLAITEGFKTSKHKNFPYNLLMRDVVIQEERVLKAIGK